MIRTQQPRPTAYVNTSTQIRMPTAYMTRGQQPMQFQQPPPPTGQQQVPGQPQQQPPPQASQQPQLGQSPYPQHAHPMMMMAVSRILIKSFSGIVCNKNILVIEVHNAQNLPQIKHPPLAL